MRKGIEDVYSILRLWSSVLHIRRVSLGSLDMPHVVVTMQILLATLLQCTVIA